MLQFMISSGSYKSVVTSFTGLDWDKGIVLFCLDRPTANRPHVCTRFSLPLLGRSCLTTPEGPCKLLSRHWRKFC